MNKLIDIENKFQDYLLNSSHDIFPHIISTNKVPANIRLSIYGNAYRSRLYEALTASYPMLLSYLGSDAFEELCYVYIDFHPSEFRSIRWFGNQLAEFLMKHPKYQERPYIAELAELEWAMALVFDAADSHAIKLEDMGRIPPEAWADMRLQVHPSARRLTLSWNTVQIWQALTDQENTPEPQRSPATIDWILWRQELINQFCSLKEDETWAIDAMIKGLTFGEIGEGLCQWTTEENAGLHAASLLKGWIIAGLITDIHI